VNVEGTR